MATQANFAASLSHVDFQAVLCVIQQTVSPYIFLLSMKLEAFITTLMTATPAAQLASCHTELLRHCLPNSTPVSIMERAEKCDHVSLRHPPSFALSRIQSPRIPPRCDSTAAPGQPPSTTRLHITLVSNCSLPALPTRALTRASCALLFEAGSAGNQP